MISTNNDVQMTEKGVDPQQVRLAQTRQPQHPCPATCTYPGGQLSPFTSPSDSGRQLFPPPAASLPVSCASLQVPGPFCNLVGERVRADSWQAVEKPPYFWSQHYDSAPALALQPCCLFAFFCTRFFPFPRINLSLLRLYPTLNRQEAQMA